MTMYDTCICVMFCCTFITSDVASLAEFHGDFQEHHYFVQLLADGTSLASLVIKFEGHPET